MERFYMPTAVFEGRGCVLDMDEFWVSMGRRALIVTGKTSGYKSGALEDVCDVLDKNGICYCIFDSVKNNPTVENAYEAGLLAREFSADFVVGIGGGSPLDAAKAAAVYGSNPELEPYEIYDGAEDNPLPVVEIPTTAGTGSEVTQYSVLTVESRKTKVTVKGDWLFPKAAFLDPRYTKSLPPNVALHTALDAMSHAVESVLKRNNSYISEPIALGALEIIGRNLPELQNFPCDDDVRAELLHAAMLAGMAIAHTGTTIVHSMGYVFTYFKDMPHGMANGVLLPKFVEFAEKAVPEQTEKIYKALGISSSDEFACMIRNTGLEHPVVSEDEAVEFAKIAITNKNVPTAPWKVTAEEEAEIMLWR
ncbi:MAG: iron-containing alcohol dehydrogenase [Clostridia bacterium]|nr:iron-containing alcohol dehydrogenase [Clostridia bacterium]